MKLTKLSLVAALLIGSSAFAIENTKVSGDVKLYYGTMDSDNGTYLGNSTSFGDDEGAYGNAAVNLGLTTDLSEGVSAGVNATYVTTLGLENNLVDNTWSNSHTVTSNNSATFAGGAQLDDAFYIGELWLAGTAFDTTLKVGRQALDTPLAFTETWGIDQNTFEAAVLINQSIPDTTIVATYVGKSNGSSDDLNSTGGTSANGLNAVAGYATAAQAGYLAQGGDFNTFGTDGVYVAGVINNSIKPLTVQAWYYNLVEMADAYWLQADLNMDGILAGAQYTVVDADKTVAGVDEDKAYALMLGYEMKDTVTLKVAYSSVNDKGAIGVANVATGNSTADGRNGSGAKSKLYTELWWGYGNVSTTGADSYSLTAEATVGPEIDLFAGYYFVDVDPKTLLNAAATDDDRREVTEIALVVSKSFGPLDTSLAYIYDDVDEKLSTNDDTTTQHLQVYLTYNF